MRDILIAFKIDPNESVREVKEGCWLIADSFYLKAYKEETAARRTVRINRKLASHTKLP